MRLTTRHIWRRAMRSPRHDVETRLSCAVTKLIDDATWAARASSMAPTCHRGRGSLETSRRALPHVQSLGGRRVPAVMRRWAEWACGTSAAEDARGHRATVLYEERVTRSERVYWTAVGMEGCSGRPLQATGWSGRHPHGRSETKGTYIVRIRGDEHGRFALPAPQRLPPCGAGQRNDYSRSFIAAHRPIRACSRSAHLVSATPRIPSPKPAVAR